MVKDIFGGDEVSPEAEAWTRDGTDLAWLKENLDKLGFPADQIAELAIEASGMTPVGRVDFLKNLALQQQTGD